MGVSRTSDRPGQSGVIPYRVREGTIEVLLITSSTRKRWIIPKGKVEPTLTSRESALKEAYEEAGVRGRTHPIPLGAYPHDTPPGTTLVEVFAMEVKTTLPTWPESERRIREWVPLGEARARVMEPELKTLLDQLAELIY